MRLTVFPADEPWCAAVLAHGAGAGQRSPFMLEVATGLSDRGVSTATFDFDYMASGRRVPDRPTVLEQAWWVAIREAESTFAGLPLFIGGKSMGGRIASQVAARGEAGPLTGLVFFGYPLHPPGKPDRRRDAHLPAITPPMLFVQGSADGFGTAAEIAALLPALQRGTLFEVHGGDHSLKVAKRVGSQEAVLAAVLDAVVAWMRAQTAV